MDFIVAKHKPITEFIDLRVYTPLNGEWFEVHQRDTEGNIPKPSREIFKNKDITTTEHLIHGTPQPLPYIKNIEYPTKEKPAYNGDEGGIYVHYLDFKHPRKGFPFPEAVMDNNIAKRLLIGQIRWLAKNPIAAVSLLIKSNFIKWLQEMSSAADTTLNQFYLEDNRYNKTCREIKKFVAVFLQEIGVPKSVAIEFSRVIATTVEYDDFYCLLIQDLMSETSIEALIKNPGKELGRLLNILKERDARPKIHDMAQSQVKLLKLAFYYPGIKKAFRKALEAVNFKNLQLDEGDRYNVLRQVNYNFTGISFEDRIKKFMEIHEGVHPRMTILERNENTKTN